MQGDKTDEHKAVKAALLIVVKMSFPFLQLIRSRRMTETVQFFLALGVMIGFAKAVGYLTYRLNQPAVLGELLAGLLIGPTVINFLGNHSLFPDGHNVEHTLIEVA